MTTHHEDLRACSFGRSLLSPVSGRASPRRIRRMFAAARLRWPGGFSRWRVWVDLGGLWVGGDYMVPGDWDGPGDWCYGVSWSVGFRLPFGLFRHQGFRVW